MLDAIDTHLVSPYGVTMYDPPYTRMREDVGRVTQKFPGTAENGAVYNHAAAFYLYSLYQREEADRAWRVLRTMLPSPEPADCLQRGQLPVFVPNYYRGAWRLHPRTAGRSSQLFNTGTAAWLYRCVVEELFGLRGDGDALRIAPHLPSHWPSARASRRFRGAMFEVVIERVDGLARARVALDGVWQDDTAIRGFEAGRTYQVRVEIPA